jgi:ABC-type multidrug transport system fused ATPase/permease subunit
MAQQQTQTSSANKKISTYLMVIIFVVMAISVVALFIAFDTFIAGDQLAALILGGIGLIAMVMSLFLLYQYRRQSAEVKLEIPKVMTTIECQNKGCNFKSTRDFQRGDYVFKDLDVACQKCGGKQMITAIYKEVKEKEKTYAV